MKKLLAQFIGFVGLVEEKPGPPMLIAQKNLRYHLIDLINNESALLVCDQNTRAILPSALSSHNLLKIVVLPAKVLPSEQIILNLTQQLKEQSLIIAFGSGTITDICKYLAFLTHREFIIFPTAPSVNAYTSPTSSIIRLQTNKKESVTALMPKAVYIDTQIIKNSPVRLVLSGLYDLICSATIKVDCMLGYLIGKRAYNERSLTFIEEHEKILIQNLNLLLRRDPSLIKFLMEALLLSGLGMWLHGDSRTASQGEHMIAHSLEREFGNQYLHGELVAIGTILISKLQEQIFSRPFKPDLNLIPEYSQRKKTNAEQIINNLENLAKVSDLFYYNIRNHSKLRQAIISSATDLPEIHFNINNVFLLKKNFTSLDLAYLIGIKTLF